MRNGSICDDVSSCQLRTTPGGGSVWKLSHYRPIVPLDKIDEMWEKWLVPGVIIPDGCGGW